ncbi:phosphoethanolamine transferase [Pasteurellaceae bacterium 22721_9_1]
MKLKRPAVSSSILIFWVSLYFTVVLNYAFYRKVLSVNPLTNSPTDYFIYTMPLVIFVILNAAFQLIAIPVLHKVIIPCLIVISAVVAYNMVFFDIYFDATMLTNVLQTNAAKSLRLVTTNFVVWVVGLGIIPALLYCWVKVRYRLWWKESAVRLGLILLSVLVFAGVAKVFYQDYAAFFRNNKSITHLLVPSNFIGATIKKSKEWRENNMPYLQQDLAVAQDKPDHYRHVTVLIVGETTRSQNWGLNGYARQTTPLLAKRGDQIINFKDVSSCGTATAISVPCMFSTLDRKDFSNTQADHQDNLLDVLQRANVDVMWLENDSGCKGVCKNVPNMDVTELNLAEFCHNGECLDNVLLTKFDEIVNKSQRDLLLVLHTIGSHGPTYYERYSPEYRQFTPTCDTNEINKCSNQELVNTYDNGILYIDQFIDKVIAKLEKRDEWESAVLYVSDHGESLGEDGVYLHSAPYAIAPKEQTSVPMVMWFSPTWQKYEGVDLACLRKNAAEKSYSHDNIFSTVFGLMDMSHISDTYRPDMDIIKACKK